MSEWITEPGALDTLVALKEIRPGDEIIFQRQFEDSHTLKTNDVATVVGLYSEYVGRPRWWREDVQPLEHVVAIVVNKSVGLSSGITRSNIKAWRRPKS